MSDSVGVGTNSEICTKCHPLLSRYRDEFKSMKKQGTSLKKVKRINPVPKRAHLTHYRDLKAQNDWLRANVRKLSLLCQVHTYGFWDIKAATGATKKNETKCISRADRPDDQS